jgi:hypothetical protein
LPETVLVNSTNNIAEEVRGQMQAQLNICCVVLPGAVVADDTCAHCNAHSLSAVYSLMHRLLHTDCADATFARSLNP